jgi:putative chitinase
LKESPVPSQAQLDLLKAAIDAGIDSPEELSAFMANVCHESNNLTRTEESFRYTRGIDQIPVDSAHDRYTDEELEAARLEALDGRSEELARMMYGDRMGNDNEGDGYAYRGRGYIQLTGREMYREIGEHTGLDLENNPDLAAAPENLATVAIGYWQAKVPEAARTDIEASMLAINGGDNGEDDRRARHGAWSEYLTAETIEAIRNQEVVAGDAIVHTAPPESDGVLEHGERGQAVEALQVQLNHWMNLTGSEAERLPETGRFLDRTRDTVTAYQATREDLPDTGIADQATRDALRLDVERMQGDAIRGSLDAPDAPATRFGAASDPVLDSMRQHVHAMDRSMGRTPDEASDRVAASLTAEWRAAGLSAPADGVVLGQKGTKAEAGEYVFAYSGSPERPNDSVGVKTAEALRTPVELSLARADTLHRQHALDTQQSTLDSPVRAMG